MGESSPRLGIEYDEIEGKDNSTPPLMTSQERTWIKIQIAVVVVAILAAFAGGVVIYLLYLDKSGARQYEPASSAPETRVSTSPIPAAPDYNYILATPEDDSVWGKILAAPFPRHQRASSLVTGKEVVILGGREADAPFPMTCTLPEYALVELVGATVADQTPYVLVEYISYVSPYPTPPTPPIQPREIPQDECVPGTLFQADEDVTF